MTRRGPYSTGPSQAWPQCRDQWNRREAECGQRGQRGVGGLGSADYYCQRLAEPSAGLLARTILNKQQTLRANANANRPWQSKWKVHGSGLEFTRNPRVQNGGRGGVGPSRLGKLGTISAGNVEGVGEVDENVVEKMGGCMGISEGLGLSSSMSNSSTTGFGAQQQQRYGPSPRTLSSMAGLFALRRDSSLGQPPAPPQIRKTGVRSAFFNNAGLSVPPRVLASCLPKHSPYVTSTPPTSSYLSQYFSSSTSTASTPGTSVGSTFRIKSAEERQSQQRRGNDSSTSRGEAITAEERQSQQHQQQQQQCRTIGQGQQFEDLPSQRWLNKQIESGLSPSPTWNGSQSKSVRSETSGASPSERVARFSDGWRDVSPHTMGAVASGDDEHTQYCGVAVAAGKDVGETRNCQDVWLEGGRVSATVCGSESLSIAMDRGHVTVGEKAVFQKPTVDRGQMTVPEKSGFEKMAVDYGSAMSREKGHVGREIPQSRGSHRGDGRGSLLLKGCCSGIDCDLKGGVQFPQVYSHLWDRTRNGLSSCISVHDMVPGASIAISALELLAKQSAIWKLDQSRQFRYSVTLLGRWRWIKGRPLGMGKLGGKENVEFAWSESNEADTILSSQVYGDVSEKGVVGTPSWFSMDNMSGVQQRPGNALCGADQKANDDLDILKLLPESFDFDQSVLSSGGGGSRSTLVLVVDGFLPDSLKGLVSSASICGELGDEVQRNLRRKGSTKGLTWRGRDKERDKEQQRWDSVRMPLRVLFERAPGRRIPKSEFDDYEERQRVWEDAKRAWEKHSGAFRQGHAFPLFGTARFIALEGEQHEEEKGRGLIFEDLKRGCSGAAKELAAEQSNWGVEVGEHNIALQIQVLIPDAEVEFIPLLPLRLCNTALGRSLQASHLGYSQQPKMGYVSMDQGRKVLPLVEDDPKSFQLPLVGIWVSGVVNEKDPFVWSCCVRYAVCSKPKNKIMHHQPQMGFLLVLFCKREVGGLGGVGMNQSASPTGISFFECHVARGGEQQPSNISSQKNEFIAYQFTTEVTTAALKNSSKKQSSRHSSPKLGSVCGDAGGALIGRFHPILENGKKACEVESEMKAGAGQKKKAIDETIGAREKVKSVLRKISEKCGMEEVITLPMEDEEDNEGVEEGQAFICGGEKGRHESSRWFALLSDVIAHDSGKGERPSPKGGGGDAIHRCQSGRSPTFSPSLGQMDDPLLSKEGGRGMQLQEPPDEADGVPLHELERGSMQASSPHAEQGEESGAARFRPTSKGEGFHPEVVKAWLQSAETTKLQEEGGEYSTGNRDFRGWQSSCRTSLDSFSFPVLQDQKMEGKETATNMNSLQNAWMGGNRKLEEPCSGLPVEEHNQNPNSPKRLISSPQEGYPFKNPAESKGWVEADNGADKFPSHDARGVKGPKSPTFSRSRSTCDPLGEDLPGTHSGTGMIRKEMIGQNTDLPHQVEGVFLSHAPVTDRGFPADDDDNRGRLLWLRGDAHVTAHRGRLERSSAAAMGSVVHRPKESAQTIYPGSNGMVKPQMPKGSNRGLQYERDTRDMEEGIDIDKKNAVGEGGAMCGSGNSSTAEVDRETGRLRGGGALCSENGAGSSNGEEELAISQKDLVAQHNLLMKMMQKQMELLERCLGTSEPCPSSKVSTATNTSFIWVPRLQLMPSLQEESPPCPSQPYSLSPSANEKAKIDTSVPGYHFDPSLIRHPLAVSQRLSLQLREDQHPVDNWGQDRQGVSPTLGNRGPGGGIDLPGRAVFRVGFGTVNDERDLADGEETGQEWQSGIREKDGDTMGKAVDGDSRGPSAKETPHEGDSLDHRAFAADGTGGDCGTTDGVRSDAAGRAKELAGLSDGDLMFAYQKVGDSAQARKQSDCGATSPRALPNATGGGKAGLAHHPAAVVAAINVGKTEAVLQLEQQSVKGLPVPSSASANPSPGCVEMMAGCDIFRRDPPQPSTDSPAEVLKQCACLPSETIPPEGRDEEIRGGTAENSAYSREVGKHCAMMYTGDGTEKQENGSPHYERDFENSIQNRAGCDPTLRVLKKSIEREVRLHTPMFTDIPRIIDVCFSDSEYDSSSSDEDERRLRRKRGAKVESRSVAQKMKAHAVISIPDNEEYDTEASMLLDDLSLETMKYLKHYGLLHGMRLPSDAPSESRREQDRSQPATMASGTVVRRSAADDRTSSEENGRNRPTQRLRNRIVDAEGDCNVQGPRANTTNPSHPTSISGQTTQHAVSSSSRSSNKMAFTHNREPCASGVLLSPQHSAVAHQPQPMVATVASSSSATTECDALGGDQWARSVADDRLGAGYSTVPSRTETQPTTLPLSSSVRQLAGGTRGDGAVCGDKRSSPGLSVSDRGLHKDANKSRTVLSAQVGSTDDGELWGSHSSEQGIATQRGSRKRTDIESQGDRFQNGCKAQVTLSTDRTSRTEASVVGSSGQARPQFREEACAEFSIYPATSPFGPWYAEEQAIKSLKCTANIGVRNERMEGVGTMADGRERCNDKMQPASGDVAARFEAGHCFPNTEGHAHGRQVKGTASGEDCKNKGRLSGVEDSVFGRQVSFADSYDATVQQDARDPVSPTIGGQQHWVGDCSHDSDITLRDKEALGKMLGGGQDIWPSVSERLLPGQEGTGERESGRQAGDDARSSFEKSSGRQTFILESIRRKKLQKLI
ncbi:hypothetical protein CBR_g52746 [Chara braunii]|uniref:STIL N-terminal domain-containing protein n=1 Tax=Chara braunii TaxID=69332 RepID=A0A388MAS0_CHABU|nr:hypothetical protein CBR_g52746 [Chara braunii]|eukprot:GBG91667.1 hypothetical protein CBR_g52746 [Chara braunii]